MDIKEKLMILLKETVCDLVKKETIKIKSKLSVDITIEDIKRELNHWGSLTIPPDVAYENISYYEYNDGSGYALEFELWINNQESDLTLSCEAIIDQSDNILSFSILDLHAL
ncbi:MULTISPECIES: DUF7668 domain-containing protein [Bacillaceae]|uniref:DUF7668 domain-containing protein n=2 Tax=Bacillales TaxID=1385 RepID=UPI000BEE1CC6|nr:MULTISPECIES: hypothetical protein [unclassified Bacillus (in: firmicutes)]PEC49665.1 hypothetical protein CON00_07280 [Bacillus sp. AFS096315]PFM83132.1 hypothetical protein COJ46_04915 [Bacillus sp. AFS077874]